jgi:hypothetical protein
MNLSTTLVSPTKAIIHLSKYLLFSIQPIPHQLKALYPVITYLIACDSYAVSTTNTFEMTHSEGIFRERHLEDRMEIKYLSIYGSTALVDLGRFFSFLIYTQSVGLLEGGISPSQGRYLHTEEHKHRINVDGHLCLDWDSNPRSQCSSGRRRFML